MTPIANAIASQDPVSIAGSWLRHLEAQFRDQAMQGRAAYSRWGRSTGFPILYLGRPKSSVTVEAYRHLVDPVDDPDIVNHLVPRVLVEVNVDVTEILDLRPARARVELGLTLSQIQSETFDKDAYEACRDVAAAAHQQGFHGLIAPAATGLGDTLALFTAHLPAEQVPTIQREEFWNRLPADPREDRPPMLRLVADDE